MAWQKVDGTAPDHVTTWAAAWNPTPGEHGLVAYYWGHDTFVIALWPPTPAGNKYWTIVEGQPNDTDAERRI